MAIIFGRKMKKYADHMKMGLYARFEDESKRTRSTRIWAELESKYMRAMHDARAYGRADK